MNNKCKFIMFDKYPNCNDCNGIDNCQKEFDEYLDEILDEYDSFILDRKEYDRE